MWLKKNCIYGNTNEHTYLSMWKKNNNKPTNKTNNSSNKSKLYRYKLKIAFSKLRL